jgi:deaminated glutathione amidase
MGYTSTAAFTRATGRAHLETLLRARAIENLGYVVAAAQHGKDLGGTWRYGCSMVVDPWGEVLAASPTEGNDILVVNIERHKVHKRRNQMPVLALRQPAVYDRLVHYNISQSQGEEV